MRSVSWRTLSTGLRLLVLLSVLLTLLSAQSAQALPGFPSFEYRGVVMDPAKATYNPTGEFINPSVIRAADYFANPLGTYYLYYAPHDAPGGISLAYANSLDGPWTEFGANPLISNTWSPYYSVGHVSSPHAVWVAEEGRLFIYFHGDNTVTRFATSTDGITFTYGGRAVQTSQFSGLTEASYARVFRYTMPAKKNIWTMLLMGNNGGTRKIYLAWSNDARTWTTQSTPLISPNSQEGGQLSAPYYFPWAGKNYVAYHSGSGNIHLTEVGPDFTLENHVGVLYDSGSAPPEQGRSAAPSFFTLGNTMYMFFEAGPRLQTKIAYAKADLAAAIVDNSESTGVAVTGSWTASTSFAGYYGANYLHDENAGKGSKSVRLRPSLGRTGQYEVYLRWTSATNRATNVPVDVVHANGTTTKTVNQQQRGNQWVSLGTYTFNAGTTGNVLVRTTGTNGYVIADAAKWRYVSP